MIIIKIIIIIIIIIIMIITIDHRYSALSRYNILKK